MTSSDKRATRIAAFGVVLVAVTAAVISFSHVRTVAIRAGETELTSWLLPISIDGAVVAAVSVLLADSRAGRRPASLTWLLLALGLSASLAANVASAEPTATARTVAAWPPLALALGIEVLAGLARRTEAPAHRGADCAGAAALPASFGNGSSPNGRAASRPGSMAAARAVRGSSRKPDRQPGLDDSAAVELIRQLDRADPAGRVSRFTIQMRLGCGGSRAARLAELARRPAIGDLAR